MADFTTDELVSRIRTFQAHLAELGVDFAILNQNSDLYYYAGSVQPLYLVVPRQRRCIRSRPKGDCSNL